MEETPPPMDFNGQGAVPNNDMGGDFYQSDENGVPPMGDEGMENGNAFDTDFDPGVEANEEDDPKKFIQQLTGKLSQSLRKFNEENGPDADLNKYVAGMIAKQAMDGLSQEDADEIIDKIKADEDFSMVDGNSENQEMGQEDDQSMQMDNQNGQIQQSNESTIKIGHKIDEIVNDILSDTTDDERPYQKQTGRESFRKKPFTSPKFEN